MLSFSNNNNQGDFTTDHYSIKELNEKVEKLEKELVEELIGEFYQRLKLSLTLISVMEDIDSDICTYLGEIDLIKEIKEELIKKFDQILNFVSIFESVINTYFSFYHAENLENFDECLELSFKLAGKLLNEINFCQNSIFKAVKKLDDFKNSEYLSEYHFANHREIENEITGEEIRDLCDSEYLISDFS
ncbi:MAG TPA: hypothetical protein VN854_00740 [Mycoplasmatales bacterium]|jgi:hypothetical protein|nr:hypothetical protein [Mycoplasmatales bacterium]